MAGTLNDPEVIRRVVSERGRVAVVGLSSSEARESHRVARFLLDSGFDVVPVNPRETEVFGRRAYPSVREVPGRIDVVDIFRRPEAVGPIVEDAIARGARVVWMQLGVVNHEAAERARRAGLDVVMDHCMKIETMRQEAEAGRPAP